MDQSVWDALRAAGGDGVWVVGGSVRDALLGRPSKDLDVAVEGDVLAVGRAVAHALGGHFFVMHPASQTARVALPGGDWLDLVPLPHGLDADLRRRDFTINAMAVKLAAWAETPHPLAPSPLEEEGEPPLAPPSEGGGPEVHGEGAQIETPAPAPPGEVGRGHHQLEASPQTPDLPSPSPSRGEGDRTAHAANPLYESPVPLLPKEGLGEVPPRPQGERGPWGEGFPSGLADPTGGWDDLRAGVLRLAGPNALSDDPLRVLRALRLAGALGFAMTPDTEAAVATHAARLETVSAERVRDEWLSILEQPNPTGVVRMAARLGLLDVLLPEWRGMEGVSQNLYHHLDVWEHTLDVMHQLAALPAPPDLAEPIREYLSEVVTPPHTRRGLMNAAILLHDAGKPATRTEEDGRIRFFGHEKTSEEMARAWASRWRLSRQERDALLAVVGLHMRPGGLVQDGVTLKAIHRFFRDAAGSAPALLLLNIADRLAARGPQTTDAEVEAQLNGSWRLLRLWFEMRDTVALPLPVSGRDVMAAYGLPPGPHIGKIIQELRDIHEETPFPDRAAALEAAQPWAEDGAGRNAESAEESGEARRGW